MFKVLDCGFDAQRVRVCVGASVWFCLYLCVRLCVCECEGFVCVLLCLFWVCVLVACLGLCVRVFVSRWVCVFLRSCVYVLCVFLFVP